MSGSFGEAFANTYLQAQQQQMQRALQIADLHMREEAARRQQEYQQQQYGLDQQNLQLRQDELAWDKDKLNPKNINLAADTELTKTRTKTEGNKVDLSQWDAARKMYEYHTGPKVGLSEADFAQRFPTQYALYRQGLDLLGGERGAPPAPQMPQQQPQAMPPLSAPPMAPTLGLGAPMAGPGLAGQMLPPMAPGGLLGGLGAPGMPMAGVPGPQMPQMPQPFPGLSAQPFPGVAASIDRQSTQAALNRDKLEHAPEDRQMKRDRIKALFQNANTAEGRLRLAQEMQPYRIKQAEAALKLSGKQYENLEDLIKDRGYGREMAAKLYALRQDEYDLDARRVTLGEKADKRAEATWNVDAIKGASDHRKEISDELGLYYAARAEARHLDVLSKDQNYTLQQALADPNNAGKDPAAIKKAAQEVGKGLNAQAQEKFAEAEQHRLGAKDLKDLYNARVGRLKKHGITVAPWGEDRSPEMKLPPLTVRPIQPGQGLPALPGLGMGGPPYTPPRSTPRRRAPAGSGAPRDLSKMTAEELRAIVRRGRR